MRSRSRSQDKKAIFLTTGDVARELGVSTRTVKKWCDNGHLPCVRLPATGPCEIRDRRIDPQDFLAFRNKYGLFSKTQEHIVLFGQRTAVYDLAEQLKQRLLSTTVAHNAFVAGSELNRCTMLIVDSGEGEATCLTLLEMAAKQRPEVPVLLMPSEGTDPNVMERFDGLCQGSVIEMAVSITALVAQGMALTRRMKSYKQNTVRKHKEPVT